MDLERRDATTLVTGASMGIGCTIARRVEHNCPTVFSGTFADAGIPVRYRSESEDLAVLTVFPASPLGRYVTGTGITADGGLWRNQF